MTSIDRIDIHKDLSSNLKSNLDIHFKKVMALFKIVVCDHNIDDLESMLKHNSYDNCEVTHMLNAILNSKIKSIDDRKEKILDFEDLHQRLHKLLETLFTEYKTNRTVSERTYEDFAKVEFMFVQRLTALVIESENYEKNFDGLTNIFSRKYFFEKVLYDLSKARRTRTDFSIVIADIDYFKSINDNYGHQIGDEILVEISKLFVEHVRAYDIVARYGGEEFIFFIYSDAKESTLIFNRIKNLLETTTFEINNHKIQISCSFGIAQDRDELSIHELVTIADKALYEAKDGGRNKIIVA